MRKFPVLIAIVIVALLSGAARTLYRDAGWWPIRAATGVALGSLPSGVKQSELNVVVITLDTTRADRLGAYGYRVQTPNLDGLAREGVLFEQTESVTPLTLPAHGSLFTGRFPPSHGVRGNGGFFSDADHTTLAEVLKERGFQTGGFVGAYVLDSTWGLDQGFDTYLDGFDAPTFKWRSHGHLQRRADEVIDSALAWLDHAASSRFFAWLHFYDPHAPYEPPEPYATMHADEPYVGEIGFVDAQIGRVLAFLGQRDLVDRTIVVAVGDHGESLGEHGERTHGFFIYESAMRVPFIVRAPFGKMRGRRVSDIVRTVDVMPTVLDMLGMPSPPGIEGTSLVPLMTGAVRELGLDAYAETLYPLHRFGWSDLRMLRSGRFKLIAAPRPELYDLAVDPREQLNLYDQQRALGQRLATRLRQMEERFASRAIPGAAAEPTADQLARLATLGYVGRAVTGASGADNREGRADPKDQIDLYNSMTRGPFDRDR